MDALLSKQERISGHIFRAFENLKKIGQANLSLGVVEAKLTVLDEKWNKFQDTDDELEDSATTEDRKRPYFANDVFTETENGYLVNKGKLLDLIRQFKGNTGSSNKVNSGSSQLQKLEIPKFSGEFTEWQSFRDLFTSLVGDNASLSAIEKMHYLKMSLTDEPEALIASLPPTADNLEAAWTTLTDRYNNTRVLTTSHIANIIELRPLKTESSSELKALFNGTMNAVSALKALGRPVEGYDDFLTYLTVQKLDNQSRREWESSMGAKKVPPTFVDLQKFLESRICAVQGYESCGVKATTTSTNSSFKSSKHHSKKTNVKSHQISKAPATSTGSSKKCSFCSKHHYIGFCETFQEKNANERKAFLIEKKLCLNCLGNHSVNDCRSQKTCQRCNSKHHTMIHDAFVSAATVVNQNSSSYQQTAQDHGSTSASSHNVQCITSKKQARILLATAVVRVLTAGGTSLFARALLDQGSEASFVTESLVQRLRLPRASASVSISGIGAKSAATTRGRVSLKISSRFDASSKFEVDALVLPQLTAYAPPRVVKGQDWRHLDGLAFADPDVTSNLKIDLLLGADIFSELILPGVRKGATSAPIAQNTSLGWIISGRTTSLDEASSTYTSFQLSVDCSLSSTLQRFWEQEEISTTLPLTPEEKACEDHFKSTHTRDNEGRYIVRLPLTQNLTTLGNSYSAASRMLTRMQRRFVNESKFGTAYTDFMVEYEQLQHMEIVPKDKDEPPLVYYLPHHGVIRESSETTKLRVVFNGSQKTNLNVSLNEFLHVGPKLLPELVDVITRWRRHAIVFSADMEKMYRQVQVHPKDRDLQRILWQSDTTTPPRAYQLNTVTYGLACAPFLAIRVIRQLALDEQARYPRGSSSLLTDVYVDDVLSGADDVPSAITKQLEIINILKSGGFTLRKWTSNSPDLLSHMPPDFLAKESNFLVPSDFAFHMLGLSWKADTDCFVFHLKTLQVTLPFTKRKILSSIAELFDPLGWLAPVIVKAKIFMQSLWLLKLGWDDPLPDVESREWLTFQSDLPNISTYRIPRWLNLHSTSRNLEIHGFADASERAFAAVVYLCTGNQTRSVTLVAAKTKVAPVKQVTLPRLELCAAHLLVKLVKRVREVLDIDSSVHLWSDSTVTLAWIRGHPVRWKTYVANRVSEIQRTLPDAIWHHIESSQNPADCSSRGLLASELKDHALWWTGPSWLFSSESEWPTSALTSHDNPPEQRVISHIAIEKLVEPHELLTRYSTLTRLQRVFAWCLRFINNSRATFSNSERFRESSLSASELAASLRSLVMLEQARFFKNELATLKAKSSLSKSPLIRLSPFIDNNGLLRVGGRLKHSILDADEKHPVIIPRDAALTPLLIDAVHKQTLHGGTQLTLATIRQRFWILSGRSLVKTFIARCIRCLRFRAATSSQIMGNLPRERVTRARPFIHCGVDYAGPINLRTTKGRGHKSTKAYISVFVCFATRALHLEVVSDYTAESFLAAYKRFTSRRGLCQTISSDCGTNFVGADKELRRLFSSASSESEKIRCTLANDGVEWKFNPPSAPHFGGLWEAAVKSVKHHLRRVIGDTNLTFEEMSTLLTQIEACLNSRPIQALSDDPDDFTALTPGHFLIGEPLIAVPEPGLEDLPTSRLSRWQTIQQLRDSFWNRWTKEYLHQMQVRPKWQQPKTPLQVGDLVLITNELSPPTKWPLARVTAIHPGTDGQIRVVTVRTSTSSFKRPVVKLCVLLKKD